MNILNLTLKRQWYDKILSGEKLDEYREVKPYWINRLLWHEFHEETKCLNSLKDAIYQNAESNSVLKPDSVFKHFDAIQFTNGYSKTSPSFLIECKSISIGQGKAVTPLGKTAPELIVGSGYVPVSAPPAGPDGAPPPPPLLLPSAVSTNSLHASRVIVKK